MIRVGRGYLRAGRHADDPHRRPPPGLARLSAADQCARRMSSCKVSVDAFATYEFCELPSIRRSIWCRARRRAGRRSAVARGGGRAVPARARRRGHVGQSDRQGGRGAGARAVAAGARPAVRRDDQARRGAARDRESRRRRAGRCRAAGRWRATRSSRAPIRCASSPSAPLRRYWGDLHGQSGETIGMGSAEAYFRYARDAAFVDMVGHQGNDFQITDAFWKKLNELTARVRQAGQVRLPAGLRMVRQHRHGRRPQHLLSPRGPADPPLVAHPGRGPDLDRRDLHRRQAVRGARAARTLSSSPMSAGATPTSNTPMTARLERTVEVHSTLGHVRMDCCMTRSRRAIASASSATATTTRAGPARRGPAPRPSARSAA